MGAGMQVGLQRAGCILASVLLSLSSGLSAAHEHRFTNAGAVPPSAQDSLGKLPLAFEENKGQADPSVQFLARGRGYQLFFAGTDAVMALTGRSKGNGPAVTAVRMRFEGANRLARAQGIEPLELKSNYFIGSEGAAPVVDIPNYRSVRYSSIYAGVDLVYYGNEGQLEYDLVVAPGADPKQIRIRFAGARRVALNKTGDLIVSTPLGEIAYRKPIAYQDVGGVRKPVSASYRLAARGEVRFKLGAYDSAEPLVIDPIVVYSSYLWGDPAAIAVDPTGNLYVAGTVSSPSLPTAPGYQTSYPGAQAAYVVKLDPTGTNAIYATYLGVSANGTSGYYIAVDATGSAYLVGYTWASTYPVTPGAYQTVSSTGGPFATKLNPQGNSLVYSTFLGGLGADAIAVDPAGNLYLTGTNSTVQPTPGAFSDGSHANFIAKLNAAGSAMVYVATFQGGASGTTSLAVDAEGNVYTAGTIGSAIFPLVNPYQSVLRGTQDAYVLKLSSDGSAIVYSTYLGGADLEYGRGIAVDGDGSAYVVGQTYSGDFPATETAFQRYKGYSGYRISNGFVTKINPDGQSLAYSSYLGGTWCSGCWGAYEDNDKATAVAVDAAGFAYVGGSAASPAFPRTPDSIQVPVMDASGVLVGANGELRWSFLSKISPLGDRLVYSSLIGPPAFRGSYTPSMKQAAVDASGSLHLLVVDRPYDSFPITPGVLNTYGSRAVLKVKAGAYSTTVTSTPNPATPTQAISLSATVQTPLPGGTVTFMNGAQTLGTAAVTNGTATLTTTLPVGIHRITASSDLDGKVSPPYFQIVHSR